MLGTGFAGDPGWVEVTESFWRRDGERRGEENERRYRAMKKSSFKPQKRKSTVFGRVSRGRSSGGLEVKPCSYSRDVARGSDLNPPSYDSDPGRPWTGLHTCEYSG